MLAVIGAMLLPALAKAQSTAQPANCANNLKRIGVAFRLFATDYGGRFPMSVTTNQGCGRLAGRKPKHVGGEYLSVFVVLSNELATPKIVKCPSDSKRIAPSFVDMADLTDFGKGAKNGAVSYFVNPDADESRPLAIPRR